MIPHRHLSPLNAAVILLAASVVSAFPAVTYYNVTDYRGRADNPFFGNPDIGVVYLEDFETQFGHGTNALTTPYATGWNGATVGSPLWGVQEDYPSPDADGDMGWVWSDASRGSETSKPPNGLHFDFTPDAWGRLPEYCGAALLGRTDTLNTGGLFNSILVYDRDGNEVTGGLWKFPRPLFPDPAPDDLSDLFSHFAGIHVPGGISRILFRDFIEVDHLTYGYAPIPEPGPILLAAPLAAAAAGLRRRPRRRARRADGF